MRVHHLNYFELPARRALMDGRTVGLRARLADHCLVLETRDQLVLGRG